MMVALNSTFASHCVTHCSRKLSPLLHSPPLPRKRERERARESVCVCVCAREGEKEREREREVYTGIEPHPAHVFPTPAALAPSLRHSPLGLTGSSQSRGLNGIVVVVSCTKLPQPRNHLCHPNNVAAIYPPACQSRAGVCMFVSRFFASVVTI